MVGWKEYKCRCGNCGWVEQKLARRVIQLESFCAEVAMSYERMHGNAGRNCLVLKLQKLGTKARRLLENDAFRVENPDSSGNQRNDMAMSNGTITLWHCETCGWIGNRPYKGFSVSPSHIRLCPECNKQVTEREAFWTYDKSQPMKVSDTY